MATPTTAVIVNPTRRSPRSIERFFNGISHPGFTIEQSAILLSLTLCSGWSADRIALKVESITGVTLTAELIWNIHWIWIHSRGSDQIDKEGLEIVRFILSSIGVDLPATWKPMDQFKNPTTVPFSKSWTPNSAGDQQLFPGYTNAARERSKEYLARMRESIYYKLTPVEAPLLEKFGPVMSRIIQHILTQWVKAMRAKLRSLPELRPIREKEQVDLIMEYLKIFQDEYELEFGQMEETLVGALDEIKDNTVYIRSTAYGTKVFLGLVMADRLLVIERKRRQQREKIGFVELSASDLDDDSKNCPVCQDTLDIQNTDGHRETPIRLIVCCGQVFGKECLKVWLSEINQGRVPSYRDSCPNCRHQFSSTFLQKLYASKDYEMRAKQASQWAQQEPTRISYDSSPLPSSPRPEQAESRRIPIDLGVFEGDARQQANLALQRQVAVAEGDVEMEGM